MRLRLLGSRGAVLRLAAVVGSLALLAAGLSDGGEAQQETVLIDVNETVGITDLQQALPPASVDQSETVQVVDSTRIVPPISIEVNESVGVADSQQALPPASAQTTEAVQVSDQVSVIPPAVVQVNETIGVSDNQRMALTARLLHRHRNQLLSANNELGRRQLTFINRGLQHRSVPARCSFAIECRHD